MSKLVFANLLHRPVRSLISVLAVAIEVMMILSIVGIFMGMLNDTKTRTNGIGAGFDDAPVQRHGDHGDGRSEHESGAGGGFAQTPARHRGFAGGCEILAGHDGGNHLRDRFRELRCAAAVHICGGREIPGAVRARSSTMYLPAANRAAITWGTSFQIYNHEFRISGIVESGKGGRKLLPLDTMGDLTGSAGHASIFYIKCDDPANDETVIDEIHNVRGLADYPVWTMREWLSMMTPEKLPGFNLALKIVTGIAVIVGFLVIFQSMYTAVLERTREIGILKSVGASKVAIMGVVLRETAVLAVAGVVLGILGTFGVRLLLDHLFPTLHFEVTWPWILRGAGDCLCRIPAGRAVPGLDGVAQKTRLRRWLTNSRYLGSEPRPANGNCSPMPC